MNSIMRRTAGLLALCAVVVAMTSCAQIEAKRQEAHAKAEEVKAKLRKETKSDPITVKVIPVSTTEHVGTSSYVGTVEASKSTNVVAPASGTVTSLQVREGQSVSKGQTIAVIESQSLKSAHAMAKATYEQAQDGMARLEKVYKSGSVPEVKMVEMRTNLSKAEEALKAAKRALDDCNVKAPFAGVVEVVSAHQGEEIGLAQMIVRIVDVKSNQIHFPLPENEFTSVKVGDNATVVIPALDKTITAKVDNKGVVATQLSHSYDCTLGQLSDGAGLMPGMVCKISMASDACSTIVVPSTAVMTDMNGRYVWTVTDGIVGKNYITVGGYSGNGIVISEGLSEGMGVIVEGARKVSTGMSVKTIE